MTVCEREKVCLDLHTSTEHLAPVGSASFLMPARAVSGKPAVWVCGRFRETSHMVGPSNTHTHTPEQRYVKVIQHYSVAVSQDIDRYPLLHCLLPRVRSLQRYTAGWLLTGRALCPGYTIPSQGKDTRQVKPSCECWSRALTQAVNPQANCSHNGFSVCLCSIAVASDLLRTSDIRIPPERTRLLFYRRPRCIHCLRFLKCAGRCRTEGKA